MQIAKQNRLLFVWDGSPRYLWHAERFVAAWKSDHHVEVLHVLPDQISNTPSNRQVGRRLAEQMARDGFNQVVRPLPAFQDSMLRLVCGDPLIEVLRFVEHGGFQKILLPRFRQSALSKWFQGDVNLGIAKSAACSITWLNSNENIAGDDQEVASWVNELTGRRTSNRLDLQA